MPVLRRGCERGRPYHRAHARRNERHGKPCRRLQTLQLKKTRQNSRGGWNESYMLAVKNYKKFQHFKDRRPIWIKLYRDLLEDMEWHDLEPKAAKALVMIWLIASENEGRLPETKKLAFRLRLSETEMLSLLDSLSHWLTQDHNDTISNCYRDDIPEEETDTDTEQIQSRAEAEPPASRVKPRSATRKPTLCDDEYLLELQSRPAYAALNVQQCYYRASEWCRVNGRMLTQRFFVNWLNRERPMTAAAKNPSAYVGKPPPPPTNTDIGARDAFMAQAVDDLIAADDLIGLGEMYDAIVARGGAKAEWEIAVVAYYELHKDEPATPEMKASLNTSINALVHR